MQDFIRRCNIENYRKLLSGQTLDEETHQRVLSLLSDEEAQDAPRPNAREEG